MKHKNTKTTKMLTATLSLLLILALTLAGCAYPSDIADGSTSAATTVTTTTEPVVTTDRPDGLEKQYCEAKLDAPFLNNEITIIVFPEYNFVEYTVDDFAEIGCIEIYESPYNTVEEGELGRRLELTLSEKSKENVLKKIKILEQREDVYRADPCYYLEPESIPDDPLYSDSSDPQWAINQIDLPAAWDLTTGSSTVYVGVIDTGIDVTHPDLINRVNTTLSKGFTAYSSDPLVDTDGHGTKVAGMIGAQGNNAIGIVGTCWNVQLVSLRVAKYSEDAKREVFDIAAIAAAIEYADSVGISILNCSGGTYAYDSYVQNWLDAIQQYSGLYVCSAGNDNSDNDVTPHYPSDHNEYGNVISVGASNKNDKQWTYTNEDGIIKGSNYGLNNVDIFAPGASILTTRTGNTSNPYIISNGTSLAAPFVSGVAALLLSLHPDLTPAELKHIILNSAELVMDGSTNVFGSLCTSGGRLNAYNAVTHLAAHSFTTVNQGNSSGHIRTCGCGYSFTEGHKWVMYPTYSQCKVCNARAFMVVYPRILPPKDDLFEKVA